MRRTNMMATLYRLVYCSRSAILQLVPEVSNPVLLKQQIDAILAASRRNNKRENITGALLFTASGFAQVLEGPREVVERAFERISSDARHNAVSVLSFTPIERRSFPDWSMGFRSHLSGDDADPLAHLLADANFSGPRATTGSDVLRLLEKVVQREDDWFASDQSHPVLPAAPVGTS